VIHFEGAIRVLVFAFLSRQSPIVAYLYGWEARCLLLLEWPSQSTRHEFEVLDGRRRVVQRSVRAVDGAGHVAATAFVGAVSGGPPQSISEGLHHRWAYFGAAAKEPLVQLSNVFQTSQFQERDAVDVIEQG
jgi:hypothetical protein